MSIIGKTAQKIASKIAPNLSKSLEGAVDGQAVKKQIYDTAEEVQVNKDLEGVDTESLMQPEEFTRSERVDDYLNPARTDNRNWSLDYINTADDIKYYMDEISETIDDQIGAKSTNVQTHAETVSKADAEIKT